MAAILKYLTKLQFDFSFEKIIPYYAKKVFVMMMTSSMTSHGGLKVGPLYFFIYHFSWQLKNEQRYHD